MFAGVDLLRRVVIDRLSILSKGFFHASVSSAFFAPSAS